MQSLGAPVQGLVVEILVEVGQPVARGQVLMRLESMKMELPLSAPFDGRVHALGAAVGEVVRQGDLLVTLARSEATTGPEPDGAEVGVAATGAGARMHAGIEALHRRRALLADDARPEALAQRRAQGRRSARANLASLLDPDSLTEYGALAVAAQRSRRPEQELQRRTPADGLVTGVGRVRGRPVAVMAYDYTVLAGTQGVFNHRKADRLLALCRRHGWPLVLFAEGGGGRPGDVDWLGVAGLDCASFAALADLSGRVPTVAIAAGRCFAGNAAMLASCELVIATRGTSLGLGGPAMIEGGGLGRVAADEVGPAPELAAAGAVDVLVDDEEQAVTLARAYLDLAADASQASGEHPDAQPGGDPAWLRQALPERRLEAFDPGPIVRTVFDAGSLIELRQGFGAAVRTMLARLGGRAVAVVASDPRHQGAALDRDAIDKLARFWQLADARGWPVVSLVDTPGFMVGPASERAGTLRHAGRLFVTAAALRVPVAAVVLRRGFGLGAMAMAGGHFHAPVAIAAWPTAEFGAMGLEGAVRLGYRKELEAASEGSERETLFKRLLDQAIERGQALNMASHLEIDSVIDPAETRAWLLGVLDAVAGRPLPPRRPFVDAW